MRIDRPLWAAGVLLAPQQFQQQARLHHWALEQVAQVGCAYPWGVQAVRFDHQSLVGSVLKAQRLSLRLPDGTAIDTELADQLPPAMDLSAITEKDAVAVLALPREHANGFNCLLDGQHNHRPTRYRQVWKGVADLYGDHNQPMAVAEPQLSLRLASDHNADYITCEVARVVRDDLGHWALDEHWIPPLLHIGGAPPVIGRLGLLLDQLDAKRCRLMALRNESNARMADFAVADVSLFWLLNALNSHRPLLRHFLEHPAQHPERLWQVLASLAASLMTFSLDHDLDQIPDYQHRQLGQVLLPLMNMLGELLDARLPSRVLALPLEQLKPQHWQARLHDTRLCEPGAADFYLSVRGGLPAAQMQQQFPLLCKACAPAELDRLLNAALEGVPVRALQHAPAAVPLRLENLYFTLDLAHEKGLAMLASASCAFYVPATLGPVHLELYAVLRT